MRDDLPGPIQVLEHGYVMLDDIMGTDDSVLRAAYTSTHMVPGVNPARDLRVMNELWSSDPQHWSPFAHPHISLEFKAPIMVVNQWYKTVVASLYAGDMHAWNEKTLRSGSRSLEFHVPSEEAWRLASVGKRQGSSTETLPTERGRYYTTAMQRIVKDSVFAYDQAVMNGIAPEQARLYLPAYALYTTVYWTASLWTIIRWLRERRHEQAQWEIHQYADAVHSLVQPLFPKVFQLAFTDEQEQEITGEPV